MMKKLMIAAVFLAFSLLGAAAYAEPEDFPFDPEVRQLRLEAASLGLIQHLALSADQRAAIKKKLDVVQPEIAAMKKSAEDWQKGPLKQRLRAVVAELKAGRQPAPPDAAAGAEFKRFRESGKALRDKCREAFKEIVALLNPEQRKKLEEFRPRDPMGFEGPEGGPGGPGGQGRCPHMEEFGADFEPGPGMGPGGCKGCKHQRMGMGGAPGDDGPGGPCPMAQRRLLMLVFSDTFYKAL